MFCEECSEEGLYMLALVGKICKLFNPVCCWKFAMSQMSVRYKKKKRKKAFFLLKTPHKSVQTCGQLVSIGGGTCLPFCLMWKRKPTPDVLRRNANVGLTHCVFPAMLCLPRVLHQPTLSSHKGVGSR